jgi:hypothetical protein
MDLVPSERAVLKMICALFLEASRRTHAVAVLKSRWPALHSDAYNGGYLGLISKGLVSPSQDGTLFSVTSAGMRVMAQV